MLGPEPVAGRASHFCVRATRGEIAAWEVRSSHPPTLGCGFLFAEGDHLIECLLYARRGSGVFGGSRSHSSGFGPHICGVRYPSVNPAPTHQPHWLHCPARGFDWSEQAGAVLSR